MFFLFFLLERSGLAFKSWIKDPFQVSVGEACKTGVGEYPVEGNLLGSESLEETAGLMTLTPSVPGPFGSEVSGVSNGPDVTCEIGAQGSGYPRSHFERHWG